ncbi:MAG: DUF3313 family protein [Proteobacteria bacterium]|nr:DUF3313 family protein [Pseudomonadota bacterium]
MTTRRLLAICTLALVPLALSGCMTTAERSRFFVDVQGLHEDSFAFGSTVYTRPGTDWHTYTAIRPVTIDLTYSAPDAESPLQPEQIEHLRDIWRAAVMAKLNTLLPTSSQTTATTLLIKVGLTGIETAKQDDAFTLSGSNSLLQAEVRDGNTGQLLLAAEQPANGASMFGGGTPALSAEQKTALLDAWAEKLADLLSRHIRP